MYCNFKIIVLINQVKNINKPPLLYKRGFLKVVVLGIQMKTYNLDEYNTSKLNHKTEKKCDNLYQLDKKGIIKKYIQFYHMKWK